MNFVFKDEFLSGLKCLLANGTVLLATLADWKMALDLAESVLKVCVLLLTFCYTAYQWRKAAKKDK